MAEDARRKGVDGGSSGGAASGGRGDAGSVGGRESERGGRLADRSGPPPHDDARGPCLSFGRSGWPPRELAAAWDCCHSGLVRSLLTRRARTTTGSPPDRKSFVPSLFKTARAHTTGCAPGGEPGTSPQAYSRARAALGTKTREPREWLQRRCRCIVQRRSIFIHLTRQPRRLLSATPQEVESTSAPRRRPLASPPAACVRSSRRRARRGGSCRTPR